MTKATIGQGKGPAGLLLVSALAAMVIVITFFMGAAISGVSHRRRGQAGGLTNPSPRIARELSSRSWMESKHGRVLIVYAFVNMDPEHEENFHFFARNGCHSSPSYDYLFVVQTGRGALPLSRPLPLLPKNARVLYLDGDCIDWGIYGWALQQTHVVDKLSYRYFIFMNSSVRGPFLPRYVNDEVQWIDALVSMISDAVKLAGATVSCEASPQLRGSKANHMPPRQNPFVQSHVVVTDQDGLSLLQKDSSILQCHTGMAEAFYYGEAGSSRAVLDAGYNIDSLLLRYRGIDWRDTVHWSCNAGRDPMAEYGFDGTSLQPMEVLFTRVRSSDLVDVTHPARMAAKHAAWRMQQQMEGQVVEVTSNDFVTYSNTFRAVKTLKATFWGKQCWNLDRYVVETDELPAQSHQSDVMHHFLNTGLSAESPVRYNCTLRATDLDARAAKVADVVGRIAMRKRFRVVKSQQRS